MSKQVYEHLLAIFWGITIRDIIEESQQIDLEVGVSQLWKDVRLLPKAGISIDARAVANLNALMKRKHTEYGPYELYRSSL